MYPSASLVSYEKQKEGLRLVPYFDVKGDSIGWGHQIEASEGWMRNGITEDQANHQLDVDLAGAANDIKRLIKTSLNQDQFDALTAFRFALGPEVNSSTLFRLINQGVTDEATLTAAWVEWNESAGTFNQGVYDRRKEEVEIYFGRMFGVTKKK